MRRVARTTRFKRDYKRATRVDAKVEDDFLSVLGLLATDADLPDRLRDHGLSGEWKGMRDCHIRPDLVLIYEKHGADILSLVRLGSHSELFG